MLEFGLRRAQGPDGGLSASKYCFVGGCDATSNVLAGKLFDIPVRGTHAHAFVMSFTPKKPHGNHHDAHRETGTTGRRLRHKGTGEEVNFSHLCQSFRREIGEKIPHVIESQANDGELAAFIAYAVSFPSGFLALIDTYDTSK
jgi:nicotinate phosphoribosyltransferase